MDEESKKMIKTLGYVSTVGLAMAFSIGLGVLIGNYLDRLFGTEPWFFYIFLIFGLIAAFENLHIMYKKAKDIIDK